MRSFNFGSGSSPDKCDPERHMRECINPRCWVAIGRRISLNGLESSLMRVKTRLNPYTKWSRKRRSISVSIPSMRRGRLRGTAARECVRTAGSKRVSHFMLGWVLCLRPVQVSVQVEIEIPSFSSLFSPPSKIIKTYRLPSSVSHFSKSPLEGNPHRPQHSFDSSDICGNKC